MSDYNGWTNYATWRVNLEIFDGFNPYDAGYDVDHDAYTLGECLKEYAEQILECDTGGNAMGLAFSYAMAFLSDVNWTEIARHLIDAHKEEAA